MRGGTQGPLHGGCRERGTSPGQALQRPGLWSLMAPGPAGLRLSTAGICEPATVGVLRRPLLGLRGGGSAGARAKSFAEQASSAKRLNAPT